MTAELSLTIDTKTGVLLVEGPDRLPSVLRDIFESLVGPARTIACAVPTVVRTLAPATDDELARLDCVRISGYWHGSVIEGPGRRTVVKFQGCPLRCLGCITPESWDPIGGVLVPVDRLADQLLNPTFEREGVTILGGEPVRRVIRQ